MTRYKLVLEYDGTDFVGWQRQANGASVQQALEEAIAAFTGEAVTTCAAGRTDAGVHALAQAVHVDLARHFAPDTVRKAVNFHLRPAAHCGDRRERGIRRLRCPLFRARAALPLSHPRPALGPGAGCGPGMAHTDAAQRAGNAPCRAGPRRPPRLYDLPLGPTARRARP